jgi:hypothetical protein
MGVLLQVLEIIFEVKMKRSNEKIRRKEKAFQCTKKHFYLFFLFTLLKSHNFLICYSFKIFKVL